MIGLPGNPVSALVTFELFVRPMLRAMLGLAGDGTAARAALASTRRDRQGPGRRAYLRVRRRAGAAGYRARSAGGQGSSQLRPLAAANALLVVPEGPAATEPGATYEAIMLEPVAMTRPSHLDRRRRAAHGRRRRQAGDRAPRRGAGDGPHAPGVLATLLDAGGPKGDALVTARLAGIGGAKRTPSSSRSAIRCRSTGWRSSSLRTADAGTVTIRAEASATARTGVEMEALTAASGRRADPVRHGQGAPARHRHRARRAAREVRRAIRRLSSRTNQLPAAEHEAVVVTCSNRSAAGEREDASGPALVAALRDAGFDVAPGATRGPRRRV